jgi:hypothetical protein
VTGDKVIGDKETGGQSDPDKVTGDKVTGDKMIAYLFYIIFFFDQGGDICTNYDIVYITCFTPATCVTL